MTADQGTRGYDMNPDALRAALHDLRVRHGALTADLRDLTAERDTFIFRAVTAGVSQGEAARLSGVTQQRVNQVLRREGTGTP